MKLFILIFLFSCSAFAVENWFPVGKENAKTVWTNKQKCEQAEGQTCFDITNKDPRFHEAQTSMVDDLSKPIMKPPYNSINCDSDSDCYDKIAALECVLGDNPQRIKNEVLPGWTVSCTGVTGYEQMEQTVLVENAALKAQVLAADQAKADTEAAIAARQKRMAFGSRMVAYMGVRNDAKSLNEAQTVSFLSTYGPIMQMFQAGAINTAKAQIEAVTPDGTITTQADKDALLAEINAFLGQQ